MVHCLPYFKKTLEYLQCPFVTDFDDLWVSDLLFSPSKHRLALLEWLLIKFDCSLSSYFQSKDAVESFDFKVERILTVVSSLSLCSSDDFDLVRGITIGQDQLNFITTLIDLACGSQKLLENSIDLERLSNDCLILDTVISQQPIAKLYDQKIELLPPDVERIVEQEERIVSGSQSLSSSLSSTSISSKPFLSLPDVELLKLGLKNVTEELSKRIKDSDKEPLNENAKEFSDPQEVRNILTKLSTLMDSFLHEYGNTKCFDKLSVSQKFGKDENFEKVNLMDKAMRDILSSLSSIMSKYKSLDGMLHGSSAVQEESILNMLEHLTMYGKVLEQSLVCMKHSSDSPL